MRIRSVIVTGATGFIGRRVIAALQKRGMQVIAVTRDPEFAMDGVTPAFADIEDYEAISEFISRSDAVIHLAGAVGNAPCHADIEGAIHANVLGTLNVLDAMKFFKVPGIFAGVGNAEDGSVYAITKSTAERFVHMYNKEHGTRMLPMRLFNVYGPGQDAASGKLIVNSIAKGLRGEDLTMNGEGVQKNDFIHVDDVAEVLVRSLELLDQPMPKHALHVGTGVGITVKEALEFIRVETGGKAKIVRREERPGDTLPHVVADRERLWVPAGMALKSFQDGIRDTIRSHSARA